MMPAASPLPSARWSFVAALAVLANLSGCGCGHELRVKLKDQPFQLWLSASNFPDEQIGGTGTTWASVLSAHVSFKKADSAPPTCLTVGLSGTINGQAAHADNGSYSYFPPFMGPAQEDCSSPTVSLEGTFDQVPPAQLLQPRVIITDGETTAEVEFDNLCVGGFYRKTPLPLNKADVVEFEWISTVPLDTTKLSVEKNSVPMTDWVVEGNILRITTHQQTGYRVNLKLPSEPKPGIKTCTNPGGCRGSCTENHVERATDGSGTFMLKQYF